MKSKFIAAVIYLFAASVHAETLKDQQAVKKVPLGLNTFTRQGLETSAKASTLSLRFAETDDDRNRCSCVTLSNGAVVCGVGCVVNPENESVVCASYDCD